MFFDSYTSAIIGQEKIVVLSDSTQTAPQLGYEFAFPAMGTEVQFKTFHRDQSRVEHAFQAARTLVLELERVLTDYDPESETRQLSQRAVAHATPVSEPLWDVLTASDRWFQLSHGAFDSSLGRLTQLWRKSRRSGRMPSVGAIDEARRLTGWQHVQLDSDPRSVRFLLDGLQLDFGALGKGYVVDQAFELLLRHELSCSLVNISGNMRVGGPPPDRSGWRIEIAPLEKGGQPLRRIALANQSIATSGDLWQFVVIEGARRSHILDPATGLGVAGPLCATVVAPLAVDADALATTACVLGFPAAAQIAEQLADTELLLADKITAVGSDEHEREEELDGEIDYQLRVQQTTGFPAKIEP